MSASLETDFFICILQLRQDKIKREFEKRFQKAAAFPEGNRKYLCKLNKMHENFWFLLDKMDDVYRKAVFRTGVQVRKKAIFKIFGCRLKIAE